MDPPSAPLVDMLLSLGLATSRDLARCRPLVQRFSRDLPTFDSVWIDALVRLGSLSPFQAREIYEGQGTRLRVAAWLLLDRLQVNSRSEVFIARNLDDRRRAILTRWSGSTIQIEQAQTALQARLGKQPHGLHCIAFAVESIAAQHDWWTVSPLVTGLSLETLLVRRGRFPADVVRRIAAVLSRDLATCQRAALLHGDLRPDNIWLASHGHLQMLHPGLLNLLESGDPLHALLPLSCYDGIAPERLEPGIREVRPEPAEVYSLGCLLWQLLVGRPPFPPADHLLKLAAHRTQTIAPVAEWAPDTPPSFARLIDCMTARNPEQRPALDEIARELTGHGSGAASRLAAFVRTFESASARPLIRSSPAHSNSPAGKLARTALTLGALGLLAAGLWWGPNYFGTRSGLTAPHVAANTQTPTEPGTQSPPLTEHNLLPLPAPDANGQVRLVAGRYQAAALTSTGDLLLIGPTTGSAEIVIHSDPLELTGQRVGLSHVQITIVSNTLPTSAPLQLTATQLSPPAPLSILAQELVLETVQIQRHAPPAAVPNSPPCIHWSRLLDADVTAGQLQVRNSAFLLAGDVFAINFPLSYAQFENTLQTGAGSLLQLRRGVRAGTRVPLTMNHCTLRATGALVNWPLDRSVPGGQLAIQGEDTVFMLNSGTALIEFNNGQLPPDWIQSIEIAATGLILPSTSPVVGYRFTPSELRPLDPQSMQIDGLLAGEVTFRGDQLQQPHDSNIQESHIPLRQALTPPGFQAIELR